MFWDKRTVPDDLQALQRSAHICPVNRLAQHPEETLKAFKNTQISVSRRMTKTVMEAREVTVNDPNSFYHFEHPSFYTAC